MNSTPLSHKQAFWVFVQMRRFVVHLYGNVRPVIATYQQAIMDLAGEEPKRDQTTASTDTQETNGTADEVAQQGCTS
jgi:hypothetical protein